MEISKSCCAFVTLSQVPIVFSCQWFFTKAGFKALSFQDLKKKNQRISYLQLLFKKLHFRIPKTTLWHTASKKCPHNNLNLCWIRGSLVDSSSSCKVPETVTFHLTMGWENILGIIIGDGTESYGRLKCSTNNETCHIVFSLDFQSKMSGQEQRMMLIKLSVTNKIKQLPGIKYKN